VRHPAARSRRLTAGALGVGLVCLLVAAIGALGDTQGFFQAYLVAYTFWLSLALGCLGLVFIQFLTGGLWGLAIRRFMEAGAATLPLLAVLFVPLLFGLPSLYVWTHPEAVQADPTLQHKSLYLNVPFFVARAVVYFVAWIVLARQLHISSRQQDATPDPLVLKKLQRLSIVGLLVLGLTASFAAIDWWMSLEPEWFSTMYPPMLCMGDLLLAMAFAVLLVTLFGGTEPLDEMATPKLLNDLGSLLLAFLMLWAYMTYFQYMLVWAGNLKDEITWYVRRAEGGWMPIAWTLAIVGFLGPFWLLLFRGLKRRRRSLGTLAGLILVMQLIVVYWIVEPAFAPNGPLLDWRLPLLLAGIGGVWLAVFGWRLGAAPVLAPNDPRLSPAMERAGAHATA
jgi:hypothetical protein